MSVHGSVCQVPGTAEDLAAVKLEQVTQEQSGSSGLPCSNGHSGPGPALGSVLCPPEKEPCYREAVARNTPAMWMRPQMIKETMLRQKESWR